MYAIRDWLYIGKFVETRSRPILIQHGITAMLQLAEEVVQPEIASLYVPVDDGQPAPAHAFDRSLKFIREQKASNRRILVACGAGISRSVTFAMAGLMEHEKLDLFDAYRVILARHLGAFPHFELCISLAAYHGVTLNSTDVIRTLWDIQDEAGVKQNSR
jgi:protein-tyrosine phosphatase